MPVKTAKDFIASAQQQAIGINTHGQVVVGEAIAPCAWRPRPTWAQEDNYDHLPPGERAALADAMIERWQSYRAAHGG